MIPVNLQHMLLTSDHILVHKTIAVLDQYMAPFVIRYHHEHVARIKAKFTIKHQLAK